AGQASATSNMPGRGFLEHADRRSTRRASATTKGEDMRVAINLLTEHPDHPSGAHWCWTGVIPEMAKRLEPGEELHLVVSPKSRHMHQGYGPNVFHITYPWSNERRIPRPVSEHVYSPVRLPLSHIDVFATLIAPLVKVPRSLVIHMKTMHAFSAADSIS